MHYLYVALLLAQTVAPTLSGLDVAARAALAAVPPTACNEYGGAILKDADGALAYTAPARGKRNSFAVHVRIPAGSRLAGIYHTHPCGGPSDRLFSPADVETAKRLHVPSYIAVAFDHSVRRYDPTTDKVGLNAVTEGTVL